MPKFTESPQVESFRKRLHPEQRRAFKIAFRALTAGGGDVAALGNEFDGYYRLRVGSYRIVFRYTTSGDVRCLFAERREIIYELLRANPEWLLED
jgi:mRNA interferase RelE/StbE